MFKLSDLKQKLELKISALYKKNQKRQLFEPVKVGAGEWARAGVGGWTRCAGQAKK